MITAYIPVNDVKECGSCSKSTVCKYKDIITKEIEKLRKEIEDHKLNEIPLSVNIECKEWRAYDYYTTTALSSSNIR